MRRPRLWPIFSIRTAARLIGTGLVVGAGLCISLVLFNQARGAEQRALTTALGDLADKRVELLRIQVTRSMESLYAVAAFVRARHEQVTSEEFEAFVAEAL